jgi:hypothetical protein
MRQLYYMTLDYQLRTFIAGGSLLIPQTPYTEIRSLWQEKDPSFSMYRSLKGSRPSRPETSYNPRNGGLAYSTTISACIKRGGASSLWPRDQCMLTLLDS